MFGALNGMWKFVTGFFAILEDLTDAGQELSASAKAKARAYRMEEDVLIKARLAKLEKDLAAELAKD